MQAVLEIGGKQYLVKAGQSIKVDLRPELVGAKIDFDSVLLTSDDKFVSVGKSSHIVKTTVVKHGLDKKIEVLKHHAKKRYRRHQGHRQGFTTLLIESIGTVEKPAKTVKKVAKE